MCSNSTKSKQLRWWCCFYPFFFSSFPSRSAGHNSYKNTKVAAAAAFSASLPSKTGAAARQKLLLWCFGEECYWLRYCPCFVIRALRSEGGVGGAAGGHGSGGLCPGVALISSVFGFLEEKNAFVGRRSRSGASTAARRLVPG